MQPLLLYKANIVENAYRRILLLFVPTTLITTPLGQLLSDSVPTAIVQAVAGALVTFVACFELYKKRKWFMSVCQRESRNHDGVGAMETSAAEEADVEEEEKSASGEDKFVEDCGEPVPEDKPNDTDREHRQIWSASQPTHGRVEDRTQQSYVLITDCRWSEWLFGRYGGDPRTPAHFLLFASAKARDLQQIISAGNWSCHHVL